MAKVTYFELQEFVAGSSPLPPRTSALESRLRIGTGYHAKWYRSQREHWLGWLVFQELKAKLNGTHADAVEVKSIWNRLQCSPMMYWLAEVANVPDCRLKDAEVAAMEAASLNPKDGHPHGKLIRRVLPWELVGSAISQHDFNGTRSEATRAARAAFARLAELRPEFRFLT